MADSNPLWLLTFVLRRELKNISSKKGKFCLIARWRQGRGSHISFKVGSIFIAFCNYVQQVQFSLEGEPPFVKRAPLQFNRMVSSLAGET